MKNQKMVVAAGAASMLAALALLSACGNSSSSKEGNSSNKDFTVATVRWADWGNDYTKFPNQLAKEAGINVKWDTYLNTDWGDKKSTLMAGGNLPDAFMGSITFTDQEIAQNQSNFIPLEKYVKDMPNLQKAMKKNPALKAIQVRMVIFGLYLKKPQCVQSLRINYLSTKLGWISWAYKCQQLMTNL